MAKPTDPNGLDTIFKELAETSRELICFLDNGGVFAYINDSYKRVLGYKPSDLIKKYKFDEVAHPERNTLTNSDNLEAFECRMRHKDGHWVWLEVDSYAVKSSPSIVRVLVGRDITKGKLVQRHVVDVLSSARNEISALSQLFNTVTDPVVMVDTRWNYVFANEAALQNMGNKHKVIGQNMWELIPGMSGTSFEDCMRDTMGSKQASSIEDYYHPRRAWLQMNLYPVKDGLIIYMRNVTELRRIRETNEEITNLLERMLDFEHSKGDPRDRSSGAHE